MDLEIGMTQKPPLDMFLKPNLTISKRKKKKKSKKEKMKKQTKERTKDRKEGDE